MASEPELHRIARDAVEVRRIARLIIATSKELLSDWEFVFLHKMQNWPDEEQISYRQVEKLLQIRDSYQFESHYRGLSLITVLKNCHEARSYLSDEEDIVFIEELKGICESAMRVKDRRHLLRCAKELGIVEQYV